MLLEMYTSWLQRVAENSPGKGPGPNTGFFYLCFQLETSTFKLKADCRFLLELMTLRRNSTSYEKKARKAKAKDPEGCFTYC